jgi:hypothetical protein
MLLISVSCPGLPFVYNPIQNVPISWLQAQCSHLTINIFLFVVYLLALLLTEVLYILKRLGDSNKLEEIGKEVSMA